MAAFRQLLGWRQLSVFGRANDLLDAMQQSCRLPEHFDHVLSGLHEVVSFSEAMSARQTNAMLSLLTVIGFPFGISFAGRCVGRTSLAGLRPSPAIGSPHGHHAVGRNSYTSTSPDIRVS